MGSGSVKDINEPGFYIVTSDVSDRPEPEGYWSVVAYKSHSPIFFPLYAVNALGTKSYTGVLSKDGGTPSLTWTRMDNFGCNTPADLASLLGGEMKILVEDGSNVPDKPSGESYGLQITIGIPGGTFFKLWGATNSASDKVYYRNNFTSYREI